MPYGKHRPNFVGSISLTSTGLRPRFRDIRFQLFQFELLARHRRYPEHRHRVTHDDEMHVFRPRLFCDFRKITPELLDTNEFRFHRRKEKV